MKIQNAQISIPQGGGMQGGPGGVPPIRTGATAAGAKVGAGEQLTPTEAALREQTDAFEAFFIKQVLDISLAKSNELFGKDASDEIYASMYNDTLSKALSGGLGFSQLLFDFLRERA